MINIIPATLSGEMEQDSEPFLAVHPANPDLLAASAFTPNPGGAVSATAPVFISIDGGATWSLNNIVPSQIMTGDITLAFDSDGGEFYGGILRRPGNLLLNTLHTANHLLPTQMAVRASRTSVDQPFVRSLSDAAGNDRLYVGNNDFAARPRSATVDVSLDGGMTWRSVRIETRNANPQNGPSVRPAAADDGTVFAAYFGWRSFNGSVATADVVVVRDDNGGGGTTPFRNLLGADGEPGALVAQNVTIPWSNAPTLGQERIGSTLSLAVDPNNSALVYIAWGDRVGTEIYTLHVRRSTDRGATWSADLHTITNATNAALAIADNGTLGFLYQQVTGSGAAARWETHLEQTRDAFGTSQDLILASVPASTPAPRFLPYLGDYSYLLAVAGEFRGIFSANNTPDPANFPAGVVYQRTADFSNGTLQNGLGQSVAVSIDPFYFRVPVRD